MKYTIPEEYSALRAFAVALIEENERLRELLQNHGGDNPGLSTHVLITDTGSTGQLRIEMPDEPDKLSTESVILDLHAETGFHLTKRSRLQEKISLFRLLFTGRADVYAICRD